MAVLPAISIEGAKGVGKTATAQRRAGRVFTLDDDETRAVVSGNPKAVLQGDTSVFIDEWQLVPSVWNVVRHAVDDGAVPGKFLLAGSALPGKETRIHSGAGRIVRMMMRPLSLPERGLETPTVSLAALLAGGAPIDGITSIGVGDYLDEILSSGLPGIRSAAPGARSDLLQSYVDRIVDHEIDELSERSRRSESVRAWLAAYGAATATTTSYSTLLDAATPGEDDKPGRATAMVYRDLLQRMWVLDPLPAWIPGWGHIDRLGQAPKHHLVDPALAAVLVGATSESLLTGAGPAGVKRDGTFFGALFESLAVQTVRVLAAAGATTAHFRRNGGEQEVDVIVVRPDRRVLAVEVKLAATVRPADVRGLNWLATQAPDMVVDKVLLNTGTIAYRRPDGVAVVPLALLGL